MKRPLLLGFALIFTLTLSAQRPMPIADHVFPTGSPDFPHSTKKQLLPSVAGSPAALQNPNTLSVISIGQSVNAYSLSGNARTCLWADPTTNSVAFFHRLNGNESMGSSIGVDISKNGGQSWENNLVVYSPAGPPIPPQAYSQGAGRFPQGAIFNPSGNTNINNAYVHYFNPALDGSNPYAPGGWGGIAWGVVRADSMIQPTQHTMSSGVGYAHTAPNAFTLHDTLAFMVEPLFQGSEFSDTLILARGVWNNVTSDFNYSRQKITMPTDWKVTDAKIAFSPDGYYGFISVISHNSSKPLKDSTYYPILYRTSNGGQTWSGPINVNLYGDYGIQEVKDYLSDGDLNFLFGYVPDRDSLFFTTIGDHDLTVDMNGNPHIGVVISLSQGSFQTYVPSTCVVFDLYSLDGGNTWHGAPLETIYNVWGKFGTGTTTLTEDNRVQMSRSVDGSRIFVSWIDTQPAYAPSNNTAPDIYLVGLNLEDLTKTPVFNVTGTSSASGTAFMAVQSQIVFGGNGQFTIPFVCQSMTPANVTLPVQYKYIDGFLIDDSQFTAEFGTTLITQLDNFSACKGETVIPIHVINCNNVAAISLSLEYDDSMLTYMGYQNLHPLLAGGSLLINAMNHHVQISWYSLDPFSINDGVLCELVFYAYPGDSPLSWDIITQAACEYTNINADIIPAAFIDGHITVTDCGLQGAVTYDNLASTPLTNTTVIAKQGTTIMDADTTNSQGLYALTDLDNGTYVVTAFTSKVWGGANSVDALTIQKYFAGYVPLYNMKLKAADVNNSIGVNSVDALQIARRFVGLITSFGSGDWYFIKDTVELDSTTGIVDLKGICFGDVNGSYNPLLKEGPPPALRCTGNEKMTATGLVDIPFRADMDAEVASISCILNYKPSQIRILDINMEAEGTLVYNILPDQFRLSWYSLMPMQLKAGDALFSLRCEIQQSADRFVPEFVLEPGTVFSDFDGNTLTGLTLSFPAFQNDNSALWIGQNQPNPFSGTSEFPYYLPEDAQLNLSIYNMLGECLSTEKMEVSAGNHKGKIDAGKLAPGIYYYVLEATGKEKAYRGIRKMVVAD